LSTLSTFKMTRERRKEICQSISPPNIGLDGTTYLQFNPFKDSKYSLLGHRRKASINSTRKREWHTSRFRYKSHQESNCYYLNCILKFVPFSLKISTTTIS
jgi:hypothetical protein